MNDARRRKNGFVTAGLATALMIFGISGCGRLERAAEQIGNPVSTAAPYEADGQAQALHARLFVADLHADTLLSARDPRVAAGYRHLDLPRLRAGRVQIQVFSIVTNMPFCLGSDFCGRYPNLVSLLVAAQGWPIRTWTSDKARALYQAAKLRDVAADPGAGLVLLRERDDLVRLLAEPLATRRVGAVLAVEGAQAVGDDVAGVDELADAGVRVLGLAHYFDNAVAGSAHGRNRNGITSFGWEVLRRARARGMIIDLAHAAPQAVADFLPASAGAPFIVSHTGLRTVCDEERNLTPAQVRSVVRAGGLIGVGAWSRVLCLGRDDPATAYAGKMVRTILDIIALAEEVRLGHGDEYVALGSDFDGWVRVGFDASGWVLVTQGLLQAGIGEAGIARIMGGNVCRLLLRSLPGDGGAPLTDPCGGR